jgi:hypothetical protein
MHCHQQPWFWSVRKMLQDESRLQSKDKPIPLILKRALQCPLRPFFFASVGYFADPFLIRAVSTTVKHAAGLYSVPNYLTAAVRTLRRHGLNCTLKAIKNMRFARCSNLECLVIVIATGFTACHRYFLLPKLNNIGSVNDYASDVP